MFLFYVTVSCVLLGSSADIIFEELCYGRHLNLPNIYAPSYFKGQMYFTPSKGGPRRLLMDNGEVKDPRITMSLTSLRISDLTEKDDGTFSISYGDRLYNIAVVEILDCVDLEVQKSYGDSYFISVLESAEFLEFTPLGDQQQTQVLWNRTDPQTNKGGRGQMKRYSFEMNKLTQADSGFYNIRKKDNSLQSRIRIRVNENKRHYDAEVGTLLTIRYPGISAPWTVTFTPQWEEDQQLVMTEGSLITGGYLDVPKHQFRDRIWVDHAALSIDPVESRDSGMFEFRDPQGNLAQTVQVKVNGLVPTFVYVVIIAGSIFGVIACCCCVRKCCCKKSSSKRDESVPAAAPANYCHVENQPAGPSFSAPAYSTPAYSSQPLNSLVSREPTSTSVGPSVYNPVNIHVNPLQSEVAPLEGQGATPALSANSGWLTSDLQPTFELKGLSFPSAPPLSSDSTFSDVYTSDKLNFL